MTTANPRTPRWVKILLAASLGLNLVGGGLLIGAALRPHPPRPMPPLALGINRAIDVLPEADRDTARAVLRDLRAEMGPIMASAGADRAEAAALLTRTPPDIAALKDLLNRRSLQFGTAIRAMNDRAIDMIVTLSPEGRAALAAYLTRPDPHHGGRSEHGHDGRERERQRDGSPAVDQDAPDQEAPDQDGDEG